MPGRVLLSDACASTQINWSVIGVPREGRQFKFALHLQTACCSNSLPQAACPPTPVLCRDHSETVHKAAALSVLQLLVQF